jgi:hypothetical protein
MLNHRCEQVQYTHYRSKNSYWLENPVLVKPPTKEIGNVPLHVTTVTLTQRRACRNSWHAKTTNFLAIRGLDLDRSRGRVRWKLASSSFFPEKAFVSSINNHNDVATN